MGIKLPNSLAFFPFFVDEFSSLPKGINGTSPMLNYSQILKTWGMFPSSSHQDKRGMQGLHEGWLGKDNTLSMNIFQLSHQLHKPNKEGLVQLNPILVFWLVI
jgi:hypothetical protein